LQKEGKEKVNERSNKECKKLFLFGGRVKDTFLVTTKNTIMEQDLSQTL